MTVQRRSKAFPGARIVASPFVPHRDAVRGFVFDVASGRLSEMGTA